MVENLVIALVYDLIYSKLFIDQLLVQSRINLYSLNFLGLGIICYYFVHNLKHPYQSLRMVIIILLTVLFDLS